MEIKHTTAQFKRKVKERKSFLAAFFFPGHFGACQKKINKLGIFFFLIFSEIYRIRKVKKKKNFSFFTVILLKCM